MKKLILSMVAIATISLSSFGQAPEGFKYQAVVRDAGNLILNNQAVGMRMTIQQGSIGGTTVYQETFAQTTNAYGLVNLEIGSGTVVSGDFTTIDWSAGPYFIETAVDVTGGISYVVMGTSELMSVPYAIYAKTAENVTNDLVDDADADPNNEIQAVSFSNDTLYLSNGGQVYLGSYGVDLVDDADADPNNEIQDLQLLGNILTITNNGTATTIDLSGYLDNTDTQLDETAVDAFVSNNGYITSPNDADADPNNEIQAVSFSNDTLYLSNGGQVYLGSYGVDLVDDADADPNNEIQDLQLLGNILTITNNGTATTIDLSGYLDNTDTQLDETAVDAFVSNNGYITSPNDADADPNNEIQAVSFSNDTLYLSNGGQVYLGSYGVDLVDDADADPNNEIQDLQLLGNILTITNNGTATTIDLSGYLDNTDTQLDETAVDAFVSNNGYITSPNDADADPNNEIQAVSFSNDTLYLSNGGQVYLGSYGVDLVDDADADPNNEIQDLQLLGNILTITNNGTATTIDLSGYLDNTDTQLDETAVDAFVSNNGYITSPNDADADPNNEIELPAGGTNGQVLITDGSGNYSWVDQTTDTDTQLDSLGIAAFGYVAGGQPDYLETASTSTFPPLAVNNGILVMVRIHTQCSSTATGGLIFIQNNGDVTVMTSAGSEGSSLTSVGNVLSLNNACIAPWTWTFAVSGGIATVTQGGGGGFFQAAKWSILGD